MTGKKPFVNEWAIFLTIISHGLLHFYLGFIYKCASGAVPVGELLFGVFAAGLSYFILGGFSSLGFGLSSIIGSVLAGLLTVFLSRGEKGVASIFLITQLLASGAGALFPKPDTLSPLTGNLFIFPSLVSLIELVACCKPDGSKGLFNKLGGHAWHDFFLHISVLASLIDPAPKKDKED